MQTNVAADGSADAERCGFSAFVLTPALAAVYDRSDVMCLGKPWWDYWLPYAALRAGIQLRRPRHAALTHAVHARSGWDDDDWLRCARELARLMNDPPPADQGAAHAYALTVHTAITEAAVALELEGSP